MQYWPKVVDRSRTASDNLYRMKTLFHLGQLLYGEADKEAAEAMRKEARMRLTRGAVESTGSSTSLSRRSRERIPAVSSLGKRRGISSSHSRDGEREKRKVRSPSPRLTSSTSSGAQQDESRAKKAPAKKKSRVCKLFSSSRSSSGEGSISSSSNSCDSSSRDSSSSSSSEDEAIGQDEILDRGDEEQLHMLKGKEAARKKEKRREREKEKQKVVRRVKVLNAVVEQTLRTKKEQLDELVEAKKQIKKLEKSPKQESGKEGEKPEAEQQEKEAAEAGGSEADLMETGRGEHSKEQTEEDKKRIVRYKTLKERLGSPAPAAAGETSAAVAEGAHQLSRLASYTIPRAVSPIPKSCFESLPSTLDG